jgi:hypothetical protein
MKVTPLDDLQPLVVIEVQEVCVIEDEPQLAPYQVPRDKQVGDSTISDDPEPIASPFESHAEFQEDEGEDLNTQECVDDCSFMRHSLDRTPLDWVEMT